MASPPTHSHARCGVLVISKSPVDRVVIAKIVERCGLRPVCEEPAKAGLRLQELQPGIVIVDFDAGCEGVLALVCDQQRVSPARLPRTIVLSRSGAALDELTAGNAAVDAVVRKPLTAETLQPVIDRLRGTVRG